MANVVIVGMQWGDEGKGKIVDLLCPGYDAVVRYQGGHNAGHTVKFGDRHFSLHLIPSGILHSEMTCALGNGMVVAPDALFTELESLQAAGVSSDGRLFISNRAQTILPWHVELDVAREAARGKQAIGTTARGIGPAYESKASRVGLRLGDLGAPGLRKRLERLFARTDAELRALDPSDSAGPKSIDEVEDLCRGWAERLTSSLTDTEALLHGWIEDGKSLLFEGAQGALLDIDHGTYPYVTSSNSTAGGASTGTGVPPTQLDGVIGVLKAYTTRVGGGPFTTELEDAVGGFLRERGNEFGTTTGRPRRCGWLDLVAARYARRLNGIDAIALTKLDVLDDFDEISVCTHYDVDGERLENLPADPHAFKSARPVYETVPGWKTSTVGSLAWEDLPKAARNYLDLIEEAVGAPIEIISSGPRREETIVRRGGALERLHGDRVTQIEAGLRD